LDKNALAKFHRDNIVKVAEALFASNGVSKTTMDDIAKTADYSKATVYAYFKSKDEICESITYNGFIMLKERIIKAIRRDGGIVKQYYNICNTIAVFAEEHPLHFDFLANTQSLQKDIYAVGEQINEILFELITNGIQSGQLRESILLPQAVFVLWSNLIGIIWQSNQKENYIKTGMKITKQELQKYGFDMLLNSLLKELTIKKSRE
jgi:AcrR family transcriptional regulator